MLSHKKSLSILKKTNALLEGHFVLSSGLHSPKYIQCAKLLSYPHLAKKICESLIGGVINVNFRINLQNGENYSGEIDNCNIVGDCMEDIIYPIIKKIFSPYLVLLCSKISIDINLSDHCLELFAKSLDQTNSGKSKSIRYLL